MIECRLDGINDAHFIDQLIFCALALSEVYGTFYLGEIRKKVQLFVLLNFLDYCVILI